MWKLVIFLLVGLVLASILLTGINSAAEDKGDESKEEVKVGDKEDESEEEVEKEEGYRLTPADKRSQLLSIFLILAIMALTI